MTHMVEQVLYHWALSPPQRSTGDALTMQPLTVCFPHLVVDGPADPYMAAVTAFTTSDGTEERECKVRTLPRRAASDGDFYADLEGDAFAIDVMHVFTMARSALEMVRGVVCVERRWEEQRGWKWAWQQEGEGPPARDGHCDGELTSPLRLIAHANNRVGASYFRSKRALLFYFTVIPPVGKVYACRSSSMVAHEAGHAILDAIQPTYYNASALGDALHLTCEALHEAFADATWMFLTLSRLEWCADVLRECCGDLRKSCCANEVGGQPMSAAHVSRQGEDDGAVDPLTRSFLHSKTAYDCGRGVYANAIVFVAFLWDALVLLHDHRLFHGDDAARNLHATAVHLCQVFVRSICRCSKVQPSFRELSSLMSSDDVLDSAFSSLRDGGAVSPPHEPQSTSSTFQRIVRDCAKARGIEMLCVPRTQQRRTLLGDY